MHTKERRAYILEKLKNSDMPITGSQFSEELGITRQVVVADVALLRAAGEQIMATPQGYRYSSTATQIKPKRTIASRHSGDPAHIRDELYTIVDNGATILNVTVEHPVYGEMTGSLQISSRHDADQFLIKLGQAKAEPLLVLTDGLHLHTLQADNEDTLARVIKLLADKGYLAEA